ncbi:MAG: Acetylxylan esterase precursor [Verrucomicrobiota bacterium]|jgi:acetyl esterase/lipase
MRLLALLAFVSSAYAAETLPLWNGDAPEGDGKFSDSSKAKLTVHLPDNPNGAVIVICPGGGYGGLVTKGEGHGIAAWLNAHGIAGIVLEYRLPAGRPYVPLLDAQRALRTVRANAAKWKIDGKKVGIIGFSAGGHLASTATVHFDLGEGKTTDAIARESSRPDFSILIYPVISMDVGVHRGSKKNLMGETPAAGLPEYFSTQKHVKASTPPSFLAHAIDDKVVDIENSRMFYAAQQKAGLPTRLVELPSGGHGLNGYKGPSWDKWQAESLLWLKELKVIP